MTSRKALDVRTWLDNTQYDLMARDVVLHYDLFAYVDQLGEYWFAVEARAGGMGKLAQSLYRLRGGALEPVTATPALTPVQWGRANHATFKAVHRALLGVRQALPGYTAITTHCHYVRPLDCDPWPRGTVNTYQYGGRVGPGEAKRQRVRKADRAALPDLL